MALRLRPNAKSVRLLQYLGPERFGTGAFCLNAEAKIDIRARVSGILAEQSQPVFTLRGIGPDRHLARCIQVPSELTAAPSEIWQNKAK